MSERKIGVPMETYFENKNNNSEHTITGSTEFTDNTTPKDVEIEDSIVDSMIEYTPAHRQSAMQSKLNKEINPDDEYENVLRDKLFLRENYLNLLLSQQKLQPKERLALEPTLRNSRKLSQEIAYYRDKSIPEAKRLIAKFEKKRETNILKGKSITPNPDTMGHDIVT